MIRIPGSTTHSIVRTAVNGRASQVHDRSERDRKLGIDGNLMEGQPDARRKPIQEPVLEISLPEDERVCCSGVGFSRGGEGDGVAVKAGGDLNGGGEGSGGPDVHGEAKDAQRGTGDGRRGRRGDEETWALAAEEVRSNITRKSAAFQGEIVHEM